MSAQAPAIPTKSGSSPSKRHETWAATGYAVLLATSVSLWFAGVSGPLWLDETYSWWQISAGLGKIWSRSIPTPSYGFSYLLWAWQAMFGSREWVLRIPSLLAMAAAAYVLYRCAREFFASDVAAAVALVFVVNPIVQNEAIDVRPYAMGLLVVSGAIWSLVRWTKTQSKMDAVAFALCAAGTVYFQLLLAAILPALLLAFAVLKPEGLRWKQLGLVLLISIAAMLPVVPGFLYVAHTAHSHVFDVQPHFSDLIETFAPAKVLTPFVFVALLAAAFGAVQQPNGEQRGTGPAIVILGFFPLALLFFISSMTDLHVFVARHRVAALPGLALCWGLMLSRISSKKLRAAFCLSVLLTAAVPVWQSPVRDWRYYSWRDALHAADQNAATDHAILVICSDLPESDFMPIPENPVDSPVFAPISYYKVNAPVVGLPRTWSPKAEGHFIQFLATAIPEKKRFLAMAFPASQGSIDEMIRLTRATYTTRLVGTYDLVQVVEFRTK